ncbi:MAG: hypothetical protein H0X24_14690 [Ktedonobacterales bacterium]|nr:hypothetical protein [Ktedonobacterales bacterium]
MVPGYTDFFLASAGAAAALIGLLFVAVAIDPKRTISVEAPIERRAVAGSAFTALINAFYVSLGGLLPGYNLGGFALAMGIIGVLNTLLLIFRIVYNPKNRAFLVNGATLILASLIIYGMECTFAVRLIHHGNDADDVYTLCILLIAIYGVALSRAWEVMGAQENGLRGFIESLRKREPSGKG